MPPDRDLLSAVRADVWRLHGAFSWWRFAASLVRDRFFRPLLTYRLHRAARSLPGPLRWPLCLLLRILHRWITGRRCMQLPLECQIGPGMHLNHAYGLVVNLEARIGANVTLHHQVTIGSSARGVPVIEDEVVVYAGAIVIGPVRVGRGSTVGAGAVVVHDVTAFSVVAGNPAVVVGTDTASRTPRPAPGV